MANIYRIITALVAVFFIQNSIAEVELNFPNPDPDPTIGLFNYGFGSNSDTSTILMTGGVPTTSVASANCNQSKLNYKNSVTKTYYSLSCSQTTDLPNIRVNWVLTYCLREFWPSGVEKSDNCGYQNTGYVQGGLEETNTCPSNENPQNTVTVTVGLSVRCFSPQDLKDRDSCPDSSEDGDYVLPAGDNTATQVCLQKDDGSFCAYTKSGDQYVANFEGDCYSNTAQDVYEDPNLGAPDADGCQGFTDPNGQTTFVCPENAQDKCTSSGSVNGQTSYHNCESGCGYMDLNGSGTSTFACVSGDENENGIPDSKEAPPDDTEEPPEDPPEAPPPTEPTGPSDESVTTRLDIANTELKKANNSLNVIESNTSKTNVELGKLNTELKNTSAGIGSVNTGLGALNISVNEIKNDIKGTGTVFGGEPTAGLTGFYTKEYENGWDSVWQENEEAFENSAVMAYVKQWEVTVSGSYEYPQMCFDLGIANLGCHQLSIDPRIIAFIRLILIISALILARQITLGG